MTTTPTVKFQKSYSAVRCALVYTVTLDGQWTATEVYRDGDGWKLEDHKSGQTYTGARRKDVVAAMVAARQGGSAEAAENARISAEIDRAWGRIEAGSREAACFITTAENCMLSAEENAADSGLERHTDAWRDMVLATYVSCMDEYYGYGAAVYTTNIDDDIANGVIEAL